jgi:Tfp pilus assembly protein PilX
LCIEGLRTRARSERGAALLVALMSMLLLTALGLALVLTTSTETMIAGNFRDSQEALYSADAVIERAMQDLLTVPDWNTVLSGATTSAFIDGAPSGARQLANGASLDLSQVVNMANCGKVESCSVTEMNTSTRERPWGVNNPRYQLYAYGPINDLLPTGTINSPFYVVLMVADDAAETDGDPVHDGSTLDNPGTGVLTLRAEAFGPGGAHKVIETTVARTDSTELERGYTGQRGQDEQNRRARKSAVQTPGKALTRSEMSLTAGGMAVQ